MAKEKGKKFTVGDVVQLNSGSPLFTVSKVPKKGMLQVTWVHEGGDVMRESFPAAVLKSTDGSKGSF